LVVPLVVEYSSTNSLRVFYQDICGGIVLCIYADKDAGIDAEIEPHKVPHKVPNYISVII